MTAGCQVETLPKIQKSAGPAESQVPASPSMIRLLGLALAGAALLWLCYFPANWGWLAWVALVPLLALVKSTAAPRRIYLAAWVGGMAFFLASLQWLRVADYRMYFTWAALATYCSLYFPAAIFLMRRLDQGTRLPLVLTVPIAWTALEYARAHLMEGFAWYFLGHTQHAFLPIIQIADLGGAYAVSVLVAAVNAMAFTFLCTRRGFRSLLSLPAASAPTSWKSVILQTGPVLFLLGATLGYGWWRIGQNEFEPGPRLALLQGSLDQRIRNDTDAQEESLKLVRKHFRKLADDAALQRPDLIVWPETSFVYSWSETPADLPAAELPAAWQNANDGRARQARDVAMLWGTNSLLGVNADELRPDGWERRHNSAVLVRKDGQIGERYDKIHCVPFGEYVPFRDSLPWMKKFAPYDFDYSVTPGVEIKRFPLGAFHFGVLICYEDTDPDLARQYVRPEVGKPATDFLINISNDGWFDGTSEHEEHLAICRFRAVECRRAVARAVNMGISAVIDGNGRVTDLPGASWEQSKKVEAVLTASVPIDHRVSMYARWGDWVPATCWLSLAVGLVFGRLRPARAK
ncbi:MAG TPA: apolipoprotein N-acyltransferase [Gemmataceae bacterium]|nr:apolipoprotein N-acyltransferase [Gemmataceae bacterium]